MSDPLEKLQERRHRLGKRILELRDEFDKQGKWPSDDRKAEWDRVNADYEAAKSDIDELREAVGGIDPDEPGRKLGQYDRDEIRRGRDGRDVDGRQLDRALCGWWRNHSGAPVSEGESRACRAYGISVNAGAFDVRLRESIVPRLGRELFGAEKRAQNTFDLTAGGALVAEAFRPALEAALLDYSGILSACEVISTPTGADMPWPTADDTGNEGAMLGENTAADEQDVAFGAVVFKAYKATSKLIRVSQELLEDSGVGDLAAILGRMIGERIGRTINRKCTLGTGASEPTGLVTAATLGVTTAGATAITYDELVDLVHSVDPSYRSAAENSGFMMHDSVLAYVRKIKDGNGDPIFVDSVSLAQPDRMLGWPVYVNQHLASSVAASAKTILFGALRKYKVRTVRVVRLRRLVERYAEYDQEGFIGFHRFDGNLLDAGTHPIKYLQQHA